MRARVTAGVVVVVIAIAGLGVWRTRGLRQAGSRPDVAARGEADEALLEQRAGLRQLLEDERDARRQLATRVELFAARLAAIAAPGRRSRVRRGDRRRVIERGPLGVRMGRERVQPKAPVSRGAGRRWNRARPRHTLRAG